MPEIVKPGEAQAQVCRKLVQGNRFRPFHVRAEPGQEHNARTRRLAALWLYRFIGQPGAISLGEILNLISHGPS